MMLRQGSRNFSSVHKHLSVLSVSDTNLLARSIGPSLYRNATSTATSPAVKEREEPLPGDQVGDEHLSKAYQFLPGGPLHSYYFQKSLPRLPIPKLELTCQRYLESMKPLLHPEQYSKTEKYVADFQKGVGVSLHNELLQMDKGLKHTSYISAPWFEMYLKDRNPLPINTNPALVFVEDDDVMKGQPANRRQLVRATNLLVSALRFMKSLDAEILEPEVFHLNPAKSDNQNYRRVMKLMPTAIATYVSYLYKAFPLDMSQYPSLFRSTRIPKKGIDELLKGHSETRHIAVMRKGNVYTFDVLDDNGNILPVNILMGAIESILNDQMPTEPNPIGVMSTQNRDKWADIRDHMVKSSVRNQKSFNELDTSLFVLSLDEDEIGETDAVKLTRQFLHADGSNRWFDKSFNMIVTKDGWAGLNFEHAWGDGVAVMRFFNDIHKDSMTKKWSNELNPKQPTIRPVKLVFDIDEKTKAGIADASSRFKSQINGLEVNPFLLEKFGRKACKGWGISPDSLMQLGFQVAYHRMTSKTVTTYESCSTSAFRHGRTEAIRPATAFTKEVCNLLSKPGWESGKGQLKDLIKKCSEKHGQLTKDAAMGQGFDRHLFSMKNIALSKGSSLPDIYNDEAYAMLNYNILSTSTLSSPAVRVGAFGPVVKDGIGIAYQIWDTGLGCIAATNKGEADSKVFSEHCTKAFTDIESALKVN